MTAFATVPGGLPLMIGVGSELRHPLGIPIRRPPGRPSAPAEAGDPSVVVGARRPSE
jgi:hypothetical protein